MTLRLDRIPDDPHAIDKRAKYFVYSDGWCIGGIYEMEYPSGVRWDWGLRVADNSSPASNKGHRLTLEGALEDFREHWLRFIAWGGLREI